MARRRRPGARTSVVDGRAEIVIPIETITDVDGTPMTMRSISRWLALTDTYPASPVWADSAVAIVLDRFAWDLHLADVGHATDTHDGDPFFDAARSTGSVVIFVVDGVDPRRSKPEDVDAAARSGDVAAGLVTAFPVDVLQT